LLLTAIYNFWLLKNNKEKIDYPQKHRSHCYKY
jgi:hypothetical protein